MKVAVGYVRVSSEEQAKSGLSLENQHEKIKAYASLHDLKLDRIVRDEARSARDLDRPAVQELIGDVKNGKVGQVIVYKLDRLTRSISDLSWLLGLFIDRGVVFTSVTENLDTSSAAGRMIVHIIGVIAQWERETIAERTAVALSVKRSRDEKLGGKVPYGYRIEGTKPKRLVPEPEEQEIVKTMLSMRAKGSGYGEIAEHLNTQGVETKDKKQWHASTVRYICIREGKRVPTEDTNSQSGHNRAI